MVEDNTSTTTIIHGVMHPMRDYYTRTDIREMPTVAKRMVGTKLTFFGEEIGEVIEAWVQDDIIHYKASIETYDISQSKEIPNDTSPNSVPDKPYSRDDKDIPGCGNCIHLWDEDACLGTSDGSACLKWKHNISISKEIKK